MLGTVGEVRMNLYMTFSYELLHMNASVLADQLSADTGCSLENQTGAIDNKDE